jgi:hypothetical protein
MAELQREHEADIQSIKTEIFAGRHDFESRITDMKQKRIEALEGLRAVGSNARSAHESSSMSSHLLDKIETLKRDIDQKKTDNEGWLPEKKGRSCEEQSQAIRPNHQQMTDSIKLGHKDYLIGQG